MVNSVKLTKQLVSGKNLSISPTYVSNGHWLAYRTIFKNSFVLADPYEALNVAYGEEDDEYLKRAIPQGKDLIRLDKTEWIVENKLYGEKKPRQLQLFATEDNRGIFFDKKYIDGFYVESLWIPQEGKCSPAIDAPTWEEALVAIMPVTSRDDKKILGYELPMII